MSSTRLTGSGATFLCVVSVEEAGIRMSGVALLGLPKAVADDITVVVACGFLLRGLGGGKAVTAGVVVESNGAAVLLVRQRWNGWLLPGWFSLG